MWNALQPQLPANREIVHLNIPQPNLGSAGTALGRRLQDAAGEVSVPTLLYCCNENTHRHCFAFSVFLTSLATDLVYLTKGKELHKAL